MLVTMGKGGYGTYFTYGSFCFAMFFVAFFLVPETKGRSLEAMDELFGAIDNKFIDEESAPGENRPSMDKGELRVENVDEEKK